MYCAGPGVLNHRQRADIYSGQDNEESVLDRHAHRMPEPTLDSVGLVAGRNPRANRALRRHIRREKAQNIRAN